MKIALAQLNPTVGDLPANQQRIIDAIESARKQHADVVVFSELAICGYPPRDLLLVEGFVDQCAAMVQSIGETHTKGITMILGTPLPVEAEEGIANALVVYRDNEYITYYDKRLLPTYDVFDEDRYFYAGNQPCVIDIAGTKVGLAICEDLWKGGDAGFAARYSEGVDPVAELIDAGARLIIAPSASPFTLGKSNKHRDILAHHAKKHCVPVVSVNQVGANDDLIFSGLSTVVDARGQIAAECKQFQENLMIVDTDQLDADSQPDTVDDERLIIEALTLGVHDYVTKCGFSKVCLGLSGGIDSAIVAALGVRALGKDHVLGASMPGRFSSEGSKTDAFELAKNLGMNCITMPIETGFLGVSESINPAFEQIGQPTLGESLPDLTQENLQSRIRGTMMMALSNRTGALVLAPDQLDSDSLPDYEVLDEIVHRHIERHQNASQIIDETDLDADTVRRICMLIDRNEYKRQQMAVGLKVTTKAFGPGRRMPIAQRWKR